MEACDGRPPVAYSLTKGNTLIFVVLATLGAYLFCDCVLFGDESAVATGSRLS